MCILPLRFIPLIDHCIPTIWEVCGLVGVWSTTL